MIIPYLKPHHLKATETIINGGDEDTQGEVISTKSISEDLLKRILTNTEKRKVKLKQPFTGSTISLINILAGDNIQQKGFRRFLNAVENVLRANEL